MLATASMPGLRPEAVTLGDSPGCKGSDAIESPLTASPESAFPPVSPCSSTSLTLHASATATSVSDMDLTNLGWLQKPGVLSSMMCTALGDNSQPQKQGSQQHKPGPPVRRRPRQPKSNDSKREVSTLKSSRSSDKMVNVILNARNRKYDGGDVIKPPLSFACMIFMAVESSPTKTLPVKEIYDWVMWKFPYYRNAPPGWKNSVRHNLSLHKCFKKVERRYSLKSGSAVTKGGLWTVDPDYRRSLLSALKRTPYHPYHSYFTPPLSPSSSSSSLESVDPAERDAALTMCMISGTSEETESGVSELLHAVIHDHCYTKCPVLPVPSPPDSPCPQVTVKLNTSSRSRRRTCKTGLTLDEIAAAAELILAQDDADRKQEEGSESSDEGFGGEVESDIEDEQETTEDLVESGYGGCPAVAMDTSSALDEMGADALLCLATGSKTSS